MQDVAFRNRCAGAVAADDGDDAKGQQLLRRLRALLGVASVVLSDRLEHAAVDAACRVDVLDRQLACVADRGSRVGIRPCEGAGDPDFDHAAAGRAGTATCPDDQQGERRQAGNQESPFDHRQPPVRFRCSSLRFVQALARPTALFPIFFGARVRRRQATTPSTGAQYQIGHCDCQARFDRCLDFAFTVGRFVIARRGVT